ATGTRKPKRPSVTLSVSPVDGTNPLVWAVWTRFTRLTILAMPSEQKAPAKKGRTLQYAGRVVGRGPDSAVSTMIERVQTNATSSKTPLLISPMRQIFAG